MDRLPDAAVAVAHLVAQLDALPGVVVERANREHAQWVIRAACASPEARVGAFEVLRRAWPPGARPGVVCVTLRVG